MLYYAQYRFLRDLTFTNSIRYTEIYNTGIVFVVKIWQSYLHAQLTHKRSVTKINQENEGKVKYVKWVK